MTKEQYDDIISSLERRFEAVDYEYGAAEPEALSALAQCATTLLQYYSVEFQEEDEPLNDV